MLIASVIILIAVFSYISFLLVLKLIRDELTSIRKETIHLYAELKQGLSQQKLEVEVLKHRFKNIVSTKRKEEK
jgi:hypothetical protein